MRKVHEFTIALADIDSAAEKLSEAFLFRSLEHYAHHPHEYFQSYEMTITKVVTFYLESFISGKPKLTIEFTFPTI